MWKYLLHPIVIGIIVVIISYFVIKYMSGEPEDDEHRSQKSESKSTSFVYPLVIGAFAWFFAYCYIEYGKSSVPNIITPSTIEIPPTNNVHNSQVGLSNMTNVQPTATISAVDIKLPLEAKLDASTQKTIRNVSLLPDVFTGGFL